MIDKSYKVIFDTNVWISFLIGKRLTSLKIQITNKRITLVTTTQLLLEIKLVTGREKLRKYFSVESVIELIDLIETISDRVEIQSINSLCRDPKDNFLLDLIEFSKADFLVTGDKDLLELNPFKSAKILSPQEFEKFLKTLPEN